MQLPTHMIGKVFRLGSHFDFISEIGHYGEKGMLVRIKDVEVDEDCLPDRFLKFTADFGEFLEHNRAYEQADFIKYVDGKETHVNGHESGDYKEVDTFVVDPDYLSDYMAPAEGGTYQVILDAYAARDDEKQGFQDFLMERLAAAVDAGFDVDAQRTPEAS